MNEQQYSPSSFRILTPVVKNLLILNALFFLATITLESTFGINLTRIFGLHYVSSEYFRPYQFVTHLFMHGGFGHLFFNMFALWMFGNVLENVLGPKKFIIYYLATGLGAAILHSLVTGYEISQLKSTAENFYIAPTPDAFYSFLDSYFPYTLKDININEFIMQWKLNPFNAASTTEAVKFVQDGVKGVVDIPTVGASGAVFGLLLAFGMLFPNSLIYIYFLFPIKAKWFVIFYGAAELFLGFSNRPGDNIAHYAHLGGMLFGFLLLKYWLHNKNKSNYY